MEREFKIDITLASDMTQFLEAVLEASLNEDLDPDSPMTDTYLEQFDPNGIVPFSDLMESLIKAGVIKRT